MAKGNVIEVLCGAGLIVATLADIVPGDEIAGVPIGLCLIVEGMGW